jgi:hemoglobin
MSESIYERIGGRPAVEAAVEEFYRRVLADASLAPYFEGVDMDTLRKHQVVALTMLTGGPNEAATDLPGVHALLARAHGPRGITGTAFDATAGHLVGALNALSVGPDDVTTLAGVFNSFRPDVVTA